jgi:hypothetical protein
MITPLRVIKYLIKIICSNPIKIAFLVAGIILLYPISNLDYDLKEPKRVINSFKNGFEYCYVTTGESSSSMNVVISNVEMPIDKDGMILVDTENGPLILSWVGFIVCCIVMIVGLFANDDDINFSFRDIFIETLHDDVKCEMEEVGNKEIYYYTIDGKLILKSNQHKNRVHSEVESYFKSPNLYFKFETKQKKRNNKLEDILK